MLAVNVYGMATFYRLHRVDAPTFSADNAYSAAWGETFAESGDRYECRTCDATGTWEGETCPDCDGEGMLDADPGYSCCETAEDLLAYFDQHSTADADDPVVVFDGQQVGAGIDGEPLAIPTSVIRWTTIGTLRKEVEAA